MKAQIGHRVKNEKGFGTIICETQNSDSWGIEYDNLQSSDIKSTYFSCHGRGNPGYCGYSHKSEVTLVCENFVMGDKVKLNAKLAAFDSISNRDLVGRVGTVAGRYIDSGSKHLHIDFSGFSLSVSAYDLVRVEETYDNVEYGAYMSPTRLDVADISYLRPAIYTGCFVYTYYNGVIAEFCETDFYALATSDIHKAFKSIIEFQKFVAHKRRVQKLEEQKPIANVSPVVDTAESYYQSVKARVEANLLKQKQDLNKLLNK